MIPETQTISSLIQSSVAPVFLIAGVAGLLNVLTGRLARIMDRIEKMDAYLHSRQKTQPDFQEDERRQRRREFLYKRMQNTNMAIFFGTTTGLMIAVVILTMFASALFSFHTGTLIAILFITAMLCLIASLLLFLREVYFTTFSVRIKHYGDISFDD